MKRNVSLEEISDGRLYGPRDMVRADCGGCRGCSACCHGMGSSVILDPLDLYRLTVGLGYTFDGLMDGRIELNVVDGVILPNLKMSGETEACSFLDAQGRCSIHAQRPGICRLFPLGRYYYEKDAAADENVRLSGAQSQSGSGSSAHVSGVQAQSGIEVGARVSGAQPRSGSGAGVRSSGQGRAFSYFLQVHECPFPHKTKIRVEKWIDTPELAKYERFISDWHGLLEDVEEYIGALDDDTAVKNVNLLILKLFFIKPYEAGDFYEQFGERLQFARGTLSPAT